MLSKLLHHLRNQPLLFPCWGLVFAVLCADSGFWLYGLLVFLCVISSLMVRRKIMVLTILFSVFGYILHSAHLVSLENQRTLHGKQVNGLFVINTDARPARNNRQEVVVQVKKCSDSELVGEKLVLLFPNDESFEVGELLWVSGLLKAPAPIMNPRVVDKKTQLHRRQIALFIESDRIEKTEQIARSHLIEHWAYSARIWIREQLTNGVTDPDSAKIILAMFLGEKPSNASDIMNDFKFSGTVHVFAVSGLHVMMVAFLFTIVFRLMRLKINKWAPMVIVIMLFYAIVTGMNPPAMRAAIMGSVVLIAFWFCLRPSLPNCLWLSAIISIFWNTHSIFLPGFQLSYIVLMAIGMTAWWWQKRWCWITYMDPFLPKRLYSKWQRFMLNIRRKIEAMLIVSSAAWSGSSFLIWLFFGLITPLSIIASVPLMALVFVLLALCCLSLTLASVYEPLAIPVNVVNARVATAAHKVSAIFSSVEWLRYHHKPWSSEELIVIYQIPNGGAASYVSIGGGVMIDAADRDYFYQEVWPSLSKNVARMDSLIGTHTDFMHLEGLGECMKRFPVKQMILPELNNRSSVHRELLEIAKEKGIKVITQPAEKLSLSEDSFFEMIQPTNSEFTLADDRCPLIILNWHGKKIIWFSDSGSICEHWIREHRPHLKADLAVLGKHMYDGSIGVETLRALGVKTVVASESVYPENQLRKSTWKQELKEDGIELLLLNKTGAITLTQKEGELKIKTVIP